MKAQFSASSRVFDQYRLRLRTLSTFAYFTPEELERGFRQLGEAVAADPGAPVPASQASLLTLERC